MNLAHALVLAAMLAVPALVDGSSPAIAGSKPRSREVAQLLMPPAVPTSVEACLKVAFELEDRLQNKILSEADIERIDEMLLAMEEHCENDRFSEAASIARDISDALVTRRQ